MSSSIDSSSKIQPSILSIDSQNTIQYTDYLLDVKLQNDYLSKQESEDLYNLIYALSWNIKKRNAKVYGDSKTLTKFTEYAYKDWNTVSDKLEQNLMKEIFKLKEKLEIETKCRLNICVIQFYPNGKCFIGAHKDREVPVDSKIIGISLGATRTLQLARITKTYDLELNNGSKYILDGVTNQFWTHEILEDDLIDEPRISLTFRNYENSLAADLKVAKK
jgi:alkylated DNA repair dioxygenase AlkB